MKTKTLLIAAVMFFGLTAAAFAQATFSVGSIPVTAVVNTGYVELSGDITFSQVVNGNTSQLGTITVTYPVPITDGTPTIHIANPTAAYAAVAILSVSNGQTTGQGQVVISVPTGAANGGFSLTGVRVAVANSGLTSLSANISATNNAITAGQTNVTVISSIQPGISAVNQSHKSNDLSDPHTGAVSGTTGDVATAPVITVTEGFLNAWGDPANNTNAGIRVTLSAAPPADVVITFPGSVTSVGEGGAEAKWETIDDDGTPNGDTVEITHTNGVLSVIYRAVSKTDPTLQEVLTIGDIDVDTGDADLPIPVTSITFTVSMAPTPPGVPAAFDDGDVVTDTNQIPRYASLESAAKTFLNITGSTTTLLVPFAQTVTALNYNTGMAIANTTEDPGDDATSFDSPVPQNGTLTFYLFPQVSASFVNPTSPIIYTTKAGSPGTGLDATGKLVSGSTYTVLLSQILTAAGAPADFSGYIFVVTGFTNAHGLFNISNYAGFSQGALIPVIAGARDSTEPESLGN